ncbi:hypothetical protein H8356DRAFT_1322569 [Neocallimastix lanati (nom. inval.)]|nr:hypothetical protein H8356DRAFT_1322569 [Neocallimastix sp. JGI-2020a]
MIKKIKNFSLYNNNLLTEEPISTLDLYQQISAEKFKISTSKTYSDNISYFVQRVANINKEMEMKHWLKYLVEFGADINK